MNMYFFKQKGFWLTFVTSLLVISVAFVTDLKMELFVPETGKFRLFGGVGIIISITLLLKWRFSRPILGVYTFISIIATIMFASHGGNTLTSLLILLSVLIAILVLVSSRPVKNYVNN